MGYIVECPNCNEPYFAEKSTRIFCSLACQQTTELVRYARRKRAENTFERFDIAESISIRLAHILNGGYDKKAHSISDDLRKKVMSNANGRCQKCGRVFEEEGDYRPTIQHCNGVSNNEKDLQAWCWRCNMNHAHSMMTGIPTKELSYLRQSIIDRCESPKPLKVCDDPELWPKIWRNYPVRLSNEEFDDWGDYVDSRCPYNTGSADGDEYLNHVMSKED